MSKKPELIALSYAVVAFTSLFVNVPLSLRVNPLNDAVNKLHLPIVFETSYLNEVLFVKLLLTYLLFTKTDMDVKEFAIYALVLEAILLLIVRKSSFILHTSLTIGFYHLLKTYYPEQGNAKTVGLKNQYVVVK